MTRREILILENALEVCQARLDLTPDVFNQLWDDFCEGADSICCCFDYGEELDQSIKIREEDIEQDIYDRCHDFGHDS